MRSNFFLLEGLARRSTSICNYLPPRQIPQWSSPRDDQMDLTLGRGHRRMTNLGADHVMADLLSSWVEDVLRKVRGSWIVTNSTTA
jgi:hypothetical protein